MAPAPPQSVALAPLLFEPTVAAAIAAPASTASEALPPLAAATIQYAALTAVKPLPDPVHDVRLPRTPSFLDPVLSAGFWPVLEAVAAKPPLVMTVVPVLQPAGPA